MKPPHTHTKKLENHLEIKRSEKLEHTKKKKKRQEKDKEIKEHLEEKFP